MTNTHRKFINVLEKYMCNGLHNPIASSAIIIAFVLGQVINPSSPLKAMLSQNTLLPLVEEAINGTIDGEPISYTQDTTTTTAATTFEDLLMDLVSNSINLIFIFRFVKKHTWLPAQIEVNLSRVVLLCDATYGSNLFYINIFQSFPQVITNFYILTVGFAVSHIINFNYIK